MLDAILLRTSLLCFSDFITSERERTSERTNELTHSLGESGSAGSDSLFEVTLHVEADFGVLITSTFKECYREEEKNNGKKRKEVVQSKLE